jgi:hypothetical protein
MAPRVTFVQPREPFSIPRDLGDGVIINEVYNPGRILESDHPIVQAYPDLFVNIEPLEFDKVDRGE